MNRDEFVGKYKEIVGCALECSKIARTEGLLALEKFYDQEKIYERDIFQYGLCFVVDGTDAEMIEKILSNIIKQEKDEDMIILKNIQKEAVMGIQEGLNPRLVYAILNSYANISLKEDGLYKIVED
jgi:flagellar motor component MotA